MDNKICKLKFILNHKPNQNNLSNINFSGLKGQALSIKISDIPSMIDF